MEAVSEVIRRNLERLPPGPILLVNAPRDSLAQQLQQAGHAPRHSTQDFGDYLWHRETAMPCSYEVVPSLAGDEACVTLNLPREKERLGMLLHTIAAQLPPAARLWLAGENRGGIKSAPRHVSNRFGHVRDIDKARHCRLIEATGPTEGEPFELDAYASSHEVDVGVQRLRLHSLPGVFAHGRLDRGTTLLLAALRGLPLKGRVLDFACGNGVIGLSLMAQHPALRLTLLDSSAPALECCRRTLGAWGVEAELLASEGLSEASGRFDWIVSNPPFHRGVRSDLTVAQRFFHQAGTFLAQNGRIVVVFNRHLPYLNWLRDSFGRVERLAGNEEFTVALAERPVAPRGGVRR